MHFLKGVEKAAKRLAPDSWRKYFRASKYQLLMERLAPVDLIVHVGAHWAEDAALYESYGAKTVLWIEADPDTFAKLKTVLAQRAGPTRHLAECALVSAAEGEDMTFHRFKGDGSSSSIHKATETLKTRFPDAGESGEVLQMSTRTLPEILARHGVDVHAAHRPMLVVDVQGHELSVLKGLGTGLTAFALCKCEVSRVAMYEGGAMFDDIDAHFSGMGFRLASHRRTRVPRHGDVLYIRD
jgi:FkbM family methyltransferase